MNMRPWLLPLLLCGLLPVDAHALISCTLSSSGWASGYSTTAVVNATGAASTTINCSRLATDPTTATYTLSASNGLTPSGQINQGLSGASKIQYNEYQNATCATLWGPSPPAKNAFAGTINFGTGLTLSVTQPYYYCIAAKQAVAAGNYTDTVTETLTYATGAAGGATAIATATHPALIIVNPVCTITTPPGALSFSYTSLQATPAAASTSFSVTCTNQLPYTAGVDLYTVTDAAVNITYTLNVGLSIRPAGSVYTPGAALSVTGTGAAQTISIDGNIAAGQSGTCTSAVCLGTTTRTLTIAY